MLLGGLISITLGQDANWDLQNYHYYNGYVFFNASPVQDFLAAGAASYFNPLPDALNYSMIKHLPPRLTGFFLGAIQGINFFLLAVIANIWIKKSSSLVARLIAVTAISLLGLISANVIGEIGATFNDLTIPIWVLLSILIIGVLLKPESTVERKFLLALLAGLCLGVAVGLKLTMALYFVGAFFAFISLKNQYGKLKISSLFLLGALLGFMLVDGYWMLLLWKNFRNPIFPYYNELFQSPYYYTQKIIDYRFFPRNVIQTLFYPFYFSWKRLASEVPFRDFRLAAVYLLLIIYAGKLCLTNRGRKSLPLCDEDCSQREYTKFLIIFFVVSYLLWQFQFSIQRYAMVLDIMAPLLIYILIVNIFTDLRVINVTLFLTFVFLAVTVKPMKWGRVKWTSSYFDVQIPQPSLSQKKAVVLIAESPLAYLRPFFPRDWHFTNISSTGPDLPYFNKLINIWSQSNENQYFVLYKDKPKSDLVNQLNPYGFNLLGPCELIQTKLGVYRICPVSKKP